MQEPVRRVPKQQRALEKYHAILDAAIQVLSEKGYDATTTSNIAERAGVAVGSLYEYFPNKESIFTAFLEERVKVLLKQMQASFQEQSSGVTENDSRNEKLREWLNWLLKTIGDSRDLLKVIVWEVPGAVNLLSNQGLQGHLLPMAEFLSTDSALGEKELQVKTYILSNALYGFILRHLFEESDLSVDALSDEWFKLINAYGAA